MYPSYVLLIMRVYISGNCPFLDINSRMHLLT